MPGIVCCVRYSAISSERICCTGKKADPPGILHPPFRIPDDKIVVFRQIRPPGRSYRHLVAFPEDRIVVRFPDLDEFTAMPWKHVDYPLPDIEIAAASPGAIEYIDNGDIEGMSPDVTGHLQCRESFEKGGHFETHEICMGKSPCQRRPCAGQDIFKGDSPGTCARIGMTMDLAEEINGTHIYSLQLSCGSSP